MLPWKHYLFVDTETSGLPVNVLETAKDINKWPYIVQIAWRVYTMNQELIRERAFYIKASDYHIKKTSLKVHGITEEMANEMGVERKEALKSLYKDLQHYKPLIIGHFIQLDLGMIQAGFKRAHLKNILPDYHSFCTMKATSEYVIDINRHYPQLGELYESLFKRKMENAHTAVGDVKAVAECFFELRKRGEVDDHLIIRQQGELKPGISSSKSRGCGLTLLLLIVLPLLLIQIWLMS